MSQTAIIELLEKLGEMNTNEISKYFDKRKSSVNKNLQGLAKSRMIKVRLDYKKAGRAEHYYSIMK